MTPKHVLVFIFGVTVLYFVHLVSDWRRKKTHRQKSVFPFGKSAWSKAKNAAVSDLVMPDWGFACNQLCLEIYGVDHPSALAVKTTNFWQQEFMHLISQVEATETAELLQKLDREDAVLLASAPSASDNFAENTRMARQIIRLYLE